MTKVTRSGRIMKGMNDESSSKQLSDKGVTSGSTSTDTAPALRRSTRDTTPKKQSPASSPSTKNSERIEKSTPQTTPNKRKSERLEKLNMPSPLRRSDKDVKNHSLSVSGSKNSENGSSSLENRSKGERGEKTEEKTTVKSKDVNGNASKKLSAVKYRASLLKTQGKKDKKS
ncbi:hypothetical protein MKX01_003033, partial [Papaver californicum]